MKMMMSRIIFKKLITMTVVGVLVLTVVSCTKDTSDDLDNVTESKISKSDDAKNSDDSSKNDSSKDELIVLTQETEKDIEVIATAFVADILNKEFTHAYENYEFTKEMKAAINEAALGQILIGTKMQYGNYKGQLTNYIVEANDYRAVFVQLEFEKDKMAFQVAFDLEDKIAGFFFQEYKEVDESMSEASKSEPSPLEPLDMIEADYEEIEFGLSDYILPGTMTTTEDTKLIVVMVHGSGPNDRDATVGPNKVFKDIEQGLIKETIGSFRYDKRTLVHGAKIVDDISFGLYEETVEDAVLAVDYLRQIYGPDMKIVVLGHSQGGHAIPYIAKELSEKDLEVDGYVIMSGNYSPIYELIEMQVEYLAKLDGDFSEEEKQQLEEIVQGFEPLINGEDVDPSEPLFYVTAGYWKTFIDYNIAEDSRYINKPTLVLNGSRDYQVPASEVELWRANLDNDVSDVHVIENVNHLMMVGEGEPNPNEYYEPGHVADDVINLIVDFLSEL